MAAVALLDIDGVARSVLDCVCDKFTEADRAVCACYASVGQPIIAFCCECEEGVTGSAIVQVEQIYDVDQDLNQIERIQKCRKGLKAMELTIWVTRCHPTIDETGNFDIDDIDVAATEVHTDMSLLYQALQCCDQRLAIRRVAVDSEPQAGCSMIVGQVTVELTDKPSIDVS